MAEAKTPPRYPVDIGRLNPPARVCAVHARVRDKPRRGVGHADETGKEVQFEEGGWRYDSVIPLKG